MADQITDVAAHWPLFVQRLLPRCKRRVEGRENSAGNLVGASEVPVGQSQHLAPDAAAERCEHHREASEEECRGASDREGGRIPPGEIEGEGQRDAEHEVEAG